MKLKVTTYAPGGFDPTKPDGNVVDRHEVEVPDPIPTVEERLNALMERLEKVESIAGVREAAKDARP